MTIYKPRYIKKNTEGSKITVSTVFYLSVKADSASHRKNTEWLEHTSDEYQGRVTTSITNAKNKYFMQQTYNVRAIESFLGILLVLEIF